MKRGDVYTVAKYIHSRASVILVGVTSNNNVTGDFWASRFRPLDTLTETMERIEKEGCPLELEHA